MSQRDQTNAPAVPPTLGPGQGNGDITGYNTGLAGGATTKEDMRVGARQGADAFRIADGGTSCEGPLVDPDTGQEKHIPNG
jgi:hypothetical protein